MLGLVLSLACTSAPPGVLVVTIDTWRADHFGPELTPNAHALGQRGRVYTDAWSPIGLTTPAHASLFTGKLPHEHGMRANNHHGYELASGVTTLAEELQAAGWATGAWVSAWPAGPEGGLARGFQIFDGPDAGERTGSVAVDAARAWIATRETPWFAWVHVYEPHGPYAPAPSVRARFGGDGDPAGYDGEVWTADQLVGPLLDDARHAHVVLTSDHGEVHEEEVCGWQHERSASEQVLRVPLITAGPTVERGVDGDRVGLVDVADTVRGWAGLPAKGPGLATARTVWIGESGVCDPRCARGCAPEGVMGKDFVVYERTGKSYRRRPGAGDSGDPSLSHHLDDVADPIPPAGQRLDEAVQGLGYVGGGE